MRLGPGPDYRGYAIARSMNAGFSINSAMENLVLELLALFVTQQQLGEAVEPGVQRNFERSPSHIIRNC
jgi:hypothetical protein